MLKWRMSLPSFAEQNEQNEQNEKQLPDELWAKILEDVDDNSVLAFASVCKQLRRVQKESERKLETDLRLYNPKRGIRRCWGYWGEVKGYSNLSESWCLWCMSLPSSEEEKKKRRLISAAGLSGHLNVIKQWREKSDAVKEACSIAALGGHLEVLKYAHESGCPLDEETCSLAAYGGHLEVLEYARAHGCPEEKDTN